jgi:hypothetical protein
MEITGKYITRQSIKERRSMSINLKIPDSEKNCSKYRKAIIAFSTPDLEVLLDWYLLYGEDAFKNEIEAIQIELRFRQTLLGKELL